MCMFSQPKYPDPQMPAEKQMPQQPDQTPQQAKGRRVSDQVRGAASTILTSGSGVTATAPTEKKTLLGQ